MGEGVVVGKGVVGRGGGSEEDAEGKVLLRID